MNIVYKEIGDLVPYKNNPRKNKKAVEYVKNSIEEFGFKNPIIIDRNNVIVCGHTRYQAAKQLEYQTVPCIMADDLTDEQIKAFRIADNKTAEMAEWDDPRLTLELLDLTDFDMSKFGFDFELEDGKVEAKGSSRLLESMELKAFEHYDYLVFVFDNQMDWLNAVNQFGLHKVDAGYGNTKKIGVGRVLHGKRLLEKI